LVVTKSKNITTLSKFSTLIGLYQIEQKELTNKRGVFVLKAAAKNINNNQINLNGSEFVIEAKPDYSILISLNNKDEKFSLLFNKEIKTVTFLEKNINMSNNSIMSLSNSDENKLVQIVCLYNELTNPDIVRNQIKLDKPSSAIANKAYYTCTYTAASFRSSRSSATYHVNKFVNTYLSTHTDCKRLYGVDAGCLWGDYGCVATQEIECNGASCNF
jgi:hypothetical protein